MNEHVYITPTLHLLRLQCTSNWGCLSTPPFTTIFPLVHWTIAFQGLFGVIQQLSCVNEIWLYRHNSHNSRHSMRVFANECVKCSTIDCVCVYSTLPLPERVGCAVSRVFDLFCAEVFFVWAWMEWVLHSINGLLAGEACDCALKL